MRQKISDKSVFPKYDMYQEYQKIEYVISEASLIGTRNYPRANPPRYSLEQYVNELYFMNWNIRGTFFSISEMRDGLNIAKNDINRRNLTEERFLDFIQYAANITYRVRSTIDISGRFYLAKNDTVHACVENMNALLGRYNAHFQFDENRKEIFVAYDDDLASVVAEEFPDVSYSISEYKRIDYAGDLRRKGEVLCTLFKKLESVEKNFKGTIFENLCSDTTFLFDKAGIRHWTEKDRIASKTFEKMEPMELETWYDKAYIMLLSCLVASQYLTIKKEVAEIKRIGSM